ncbi:MAG: nuclease [Rhodospirillaceae bacterium]|nr:nuclease [Rhodospirillaceae bacterium]
MRKRIVVAAGLLVAAAMAASACMAGAEPRRHIEGPITARLLRVVDGDTIEVLAGIWPDHYVEARVRIAGIDAPELRGRCAAEVERALAAKERVSALLAAGRLQLRDVHYGKYAGRVVARVLTEDGRDVAALLLADKLARPYGGGRRAGWCDPR